MDNHVEAMFTRLKMGMSQDHVGDVTRDRRRTPILATLLANKWDRSWEDQPTKRRRVAKCASKDAWRNGLWQTMLLLV